MRKGRDVIVATRNRGKLREIRSVLQGLRFRVRGLTDFEDIPGVEEDGKSFAENGLKKARFYSRLFGKLTIADDSGLEVDALNGNPGIYSARYAGMEASDQENRKKLLKELEGVPVSKRGAAFKCVMAMVSPDGREAVTEGTCRGRIGFKEVGKRGFGYDPIFFLPRHGKTMAQLTLDEKNRISHRGKALRKLRKILNTFRE
jgi:XTP/dITP diphosphohydrolase